MGTIYDIIRPLSSGGHGDIVLAVERGTGRQVVLKFLRDAHVVQSRKTFEREIRILSKGVRGLVRMLGSNLLTDRPFYVMSYHPGGSLEGWSGKLSEKQLTIIAQDLISAIGGLHALRVFHGDIKPANLLLADDGRIRVGDPLGNGAGCTMLFSANTGGTPGYWAPEVRGRNPISGPGDVFSIGATLLHLATGKRPVDGDRCDLTAQQLLPVSPIREAIVACCHPEPSFRPSPQDLLRIVNGESFAEIRRQRSEFWGGVGKAVLVASVLALVVSGAE